MADNLRAPSVAHPMCPESIKEMKFPPDGNGRSKIYDLSVDVANKTYEADTTSFKAATKTAIEKDIPEGEVAVSYNGTNEALLMFKDAADQALAVGKLDSSFFAEQTTVVQGERTDFCLYKIDDIVSNLNAAVVRNATADGQEGAGINESAAAANNRNSGGRGSHNEETIPQPQPNADLGEEDEGDAAPPALNTTTVTSEDLRREVFGEDEKVEEQEGTECKKEEGEQQEKEEKEEEEHPEAKELTLESSMTNCSHNFMTYFKQVEEPSMSFHEFRELLKNYAESLSETKNTGLSTQVSQVQQEILDFGATILQGEEGRGGQNSSSSPASNSHRFSEMFTVYVDQSRVQLKDADCPLDNKNLPYTLDGFTCLCQRVIKAGKQQDRLSLLADDPAQQLGIIAKCVRRFCVLQKKQIKDVNSTIVGQQFPDRIPLRGLIEIFQGTVCGLAAYDFQQCMNTALKVGFLQLETLRPLEEDDDAVPAGSDCAEGSGQQQAPTPATVFTLHPLAYRASLHGFQSNGHQHDDPRTVFGWFKVFLTGIYRWWMMTSSIERHSSSSHNHLRLSRGDVEDILRRSSLLMWFREEREAVIDFLTGGAPSSQYKLLETEKTRSGNLFYTVQGIPLDPGGRKQKIKELVKREIQTLTATEFSKVREKFLKCFITGALPDPKHSADQKEDLGAEAEGAQNSVLVGPIGSRFISFYAQITQMSYNCHGDFSLYAHVYYDQLIPGFYFSRGEIHYEREVSKLLRNSVAQVERNTSPKICHEMNLILMSIVKNRVLAPSIRTLLMRQAVMKIGTKEFKSDLLRVEAKIFQCLKLSKVVAERKGPEQQTPTATSTKPTTSSLLTLVIPESSPFPTSFLDGTSFRTALSELAQRSKTAERKETIPSRPHQAGTDVAPPPPFSMEAPPPPPPPTTSISKQPMLTRPKQQQVPMALTVPAAHGLVAATAVVTETVTKYTFQVATSGIPYKTTYYNQPLSLPGEEGGGGRGPRQNDLQEVYKGLLDAKLDLMKELT